MVNTGAIIDLLDETLSHLRDERSLAVGLVAGGHFFSHLYLLAFPPLFPLIVNELSLSNTMFGALVSALTVGPLLFQMPAGSVVDRFGPTPVLIAGVLISGFGIMLVGVSPTYLTALTSATVAGIGQAAFHPANYVIINSITSERNQGRAYSVHTFGGYAGFAAAPVSLGALSGVTGWRTALLVIGGLGITYTAVLKLALTVDSPPESTSNNGKVTTTGGPNRSTRAILGETVHLPLVIVFLIFMVLTMGTKAIQTFTPAFITMVFSLQSTLANSSLTAFFSLTAFGVLVGGVFADRFSPVRVAVYSLLMAAGIIVLMTIGLFPTIPETTVPVFAAVGFFVGVSLPSRDRLVTEISAPNAMGASFGFVFTGLSLGSLVSPILFGIVIDTLNPRLGFLMIGLLYAATAGLILVVALSPWIEKNCSDETGGPS